MFKIEKPGAAVKLPLKMCLYGKQGTGKTFTGLWFAEALAKRRNGKVLVIDTEQGSNKYGVAMPRPVHADAFAFEVAHTRSLADTLQGLRSLHADYTCVVIDSVSHLWEAAREAWEAKNPGRDPALKDWGPIKKPYKNLMRWVVGTSCDVILCGREKPLFEDEDGRLKNVGVTIRAEAETLYETDVVIHMIHHRQTDSSVVPCAVIEKDRWGILAGRRYILPTPAMIEPLYPFLGTEGTKDQDDDERAEQDSTLLDEADEKAEAKRAASAGILADFSARITAANDTTALGVIAAELKKLSRKLTEEHLGALRVQFDTRAQNLAPKV